MPPDDIIELPGFTTRLSARDTVDEIDRRGMRVSSYVKRLVQEGHINMALGHRRQLVAVRGTAVGGEQIPMGAVRAVAQRRCWETARIEDALALRHYG